MAAQSSVIAGSPRATDEASLVTVTVRDQYGNPVPGITVTLSEADGGGTVVQPIAVTDASGVTTGSFSASLPASYVIEADAGGVAVTQTASIVVQ